MEQVNFGTLIWYTRKEFQHYLKSYAFGQLAPILTEINQVPPFQLIRETSVNPLTYFKVIDCDGVETDILSDATTAGLSIDAKSGFDIIKFPSTVKIPNQSFVQGAYYIEMSDGVNIWYSEYFQMLDYVENLLKIEFCHDGNFEHDGGYIDYSNGYKNRIYLDSIIAKPEYKTEEKVSVRQGRKFPEYQVSWKVHKFQSILPEFICDVLRLVWQHDFVEISQNEKTYSISEFIMNTPEWSSKADLGRVEFEFTTDVVYTSIAGRGVTSASCEVGAGGCFPLDYTAVSVVENGSAEYNGDYYIDATSGLQIDFEDNDYVIVQTGSVFSLKQWVASVYNSVSLTDEDIVFDSNYELYYEQSGTLRRNSLTVTDTKVTGFAITGSIVEIYIRLTNGTEYLLKVGTAADYLSASGITYTKPNGAQSIQVKIGNAVCGNYWESDWIDFGVPCNVTSEGMYASASLASAGGVLDDEYFILDPANVYGLPSRIVMQLNPTITYIDDSTALATLGYDTCYAISGGNPYGLPEGVVRVLVQNTTTYEDDLDAQNAGVSDGDLYVWDSSLGGGSNFIKELYAAGIPA